MKKGEIERADVLAVIVEYDHLGRERFLSRHGFKRTRTHVLIHDGKEYDSKAVAGVAHRYSQGRVLTAGEFSGGLAGAAGWLERLGFEVRGGRNPAWTRDELLLVCALMAEDNWDRLHAHDPRVVEVSGLLQLMPLHPVEARDELFRSPNSVARKSVDIQTVHPDNTGRRKRTHGGRLDSLVLHEFLSHPVEMASAAAAIRQGILSGELLHGGAHELEDLDSTGVREGRLLFGRHLTRERDARLRQRKISEAWRKREDLACEICGFDYARVYGERGIGYIECHHVLPLHEAGVSITRLEDLILICANCHRMIHRGPQWLTPAELRRLIGTCLPGDEPRSS